MAKRQRSLSAGALALGLAGFAAASQWARAIERPDYPIPALPEMMRLLRDEHDLVAQMIRAQLASEQDRYKEPRAAVSTTLNVGMARTPH
jgi:hypothetical protein